MGSDTGLRFLKGSSGDGISWLPVGAGNCKFTLSGRCKRRSGCLAVACLDKADCEAYLSPHYSQMYIKRCWLCS